MIFFTLALFALSFLATAFLAPRPELEDARAQSLDDVRFPTASEGSPVPVIWGRVRLRNPNTLWYGNFSSIPITQRVTTGLFSRKTITIGFNYRVAFQLGLCLGEGVSLHRIFIEDDEVFTSTSGLSGDGVAGTINEPDLFGGPERGGGFSAGFLFYSGGFTQSRNPFLVNNLPDEAPAYVGTSHIVFSSNVSGGGTSLNFGFNGIDLEVPASQSGTAGAAIGETAQLRPFSFEISRYPNQLGAATPIIGEDLNVICAIYDALISDWGGLDVDPSNIDTQSFLDAAVLAATEGNGISLIVSRTRDGSQIIEELLRQIDGVIYQDPQTGLIVIELIRQETDTSSLEIFDPSDIVEIRNFSRTTWCETINQVRVTYLSRARNYENGSALVQDHANIATQGGRIRSANLSFPGVKTEDLALQLATRELSQVSVPLVKATIQLNRNARNLVPGSRFIMSFPDYGIQQIVMRVQRFNLGELVRGRIVIDAIQDAFAINETVFAAPQDSLFEDINRQALEITDTGLIEAPHWILANSGQDFIPVPPITLDTYVYAFARSPDSSQQGYSVSLSQDGFTTGVIGIDREPYTNSATLTGTDIIESAGFITGTLSSITINGVFPNIEILTNSTSAGVLSGENLFFINDEIMSYETFTDNGDGTVTLNNIRRALLDSKAQLHVIGSQIFFADIEALVESEFDANLPLTARFASFTDVSEFNFNDASDVSITLRDRFIRPLPPDQLRVNGNRSVAPITINTDSNITLLWNERSREDQFIRGELDSTQTPEIGQQYRIQITPDADNIPRGLDTLTGTGGTYAVLPTIPPGLATLEVRSLRDGEESLTAATQRLDIITGVAARTHWRIRATGDPANASDFMGAGEIEFRETTGGPNVAVGGTATASSEFSSSFSAAMAFDTDINTSWSTTSGAGSGDFIAYQFAAPVAIQEISIQNSSVTSAAPPSTFVIESSTDGLTWDVEWTVTSDESIWPAGLVRTFNRDANTTGMRSWRILVAETATGTTGFAGTSEIEFRDMIGGSDLTTPSLSPGNSFASSAFSTSFDSTAGFDNNPATRWATVSGDVVGAFIAYDFGPGADIDIREVAVTGNTSTGQQFTIFDIQWSSDNITWNTVLSVPDQEPWPAGEVRLFAIP